MVAAMIGAQSVPGTSAAPPVNASVNAGGAAGGNTSGATSSAAGLAWKQATVFFRNAKPVLGLPLGSGKPMVRCGSDNTAFFNLAGSSQESDVVGASQLYSISTDGEVKSLLRQLPPEFNDISVRDFFVSDQRVVTLLRASKQDDQGVHETRYFLSTLDTQGDFKDVVQVGGYFRPLKVAAFGNGDVMVLGWDEANLLPLIAVMKEDGTARSFLDLDDHKAKGAFDRGSVDAAMMRDAAFVAFGNDVLLTFPGTVKPVLELNTAGVLRSIPITIPAGYVLHDVLNSDARRTLVERVQAKKEGEKPGSYDEAEDTERRLFEVNLADGKLLREFVPDKPKVLDVACAGGSSLTAIFYGSVLDSDNVTKAGSDKQAAATGGTQGGGQLLVSIVRR